MRRRETIQLFSTSSIDMLACGLGAVLVLWLLVFGNEGGSLEGERPLGSGEIRIRQFGLSHMKGFVAPNGYTLRNYWRRDYTGVETTGISSPATESLIDSGCGDTGVGTAFSIVYDQSGGGTSTIEIDCKASLEFSKEVSIRFDQMTASASVDLVIMTCVHPTEVHYIEVQTIDRRGLSEERWVLHCARYAQEALGKPFVSSEPWLVNFRQKIESEIKRMCATESWRPPLYYRTYDCITQGDISFEVTFSGDGALHFREVSKAGQPPPIALVGGGIRDHLARWAGVGFGRACP